MLLLLVVAIGWGVGRGLTAGFDTAGLMAMRDGPVGVWRAVTVFGDSGVRIAVALLAAGGLLIARRRAEAVWLAATVAGGIALNSGLKLLFARARPALLPHLDPVGSFSFPSGHAANTMVLALCLALLAPARWRRAAVGLAIVAAVAIGLSRLALAVHWPSDVAAGWIEGVGWVLLSCGLFGRRVARHG